MHANENCEKLSKKNSAYWQRTHDSLMRATANPSNMQCRRLARYEHMVKANSVLVGLL
jgi:hypothetical protein